MCIFKTGGLPSLWWGKEDIWGELFPIIVNCIEVLFAFIGSKHSYVKGFLEYFNYVWANCGTIVFCQLVTSLRKIMYLCYLLAASSEFCDLSMLLWDDPICIFIQLCRFFYPEGFPVCWFPCNHHQAVQLYHLFLLPLCTAVD